MEVIDLITVSSVTAGCSTILGWWLKSRLENSIKLESDKVLEEFKLELKRSELLVAERLVAFKSMNVNLLGLRRYCRSLSAEHRNVSEFVPRREHLYKTENISLLSHHEQIVRKLDEIELFISPETRDAFNALFKQMCMGFNLELWLSQEDPMPEILSSAYELYDLIESRINDVLSSFYSDLSLSKSPKSPLFDGL